MKTVATWKGSLSFGLVNIPIEIYSAVKEHSLGFKLLHEKCHTPVVYERWCPKCEKEVVWQDIVKGIKLEDGSYFILTKETIEKLRPERTDVIDIVEFIESDLLEPIYFEQHYYVVPSKVTDKAFFLFGEALKEINKIAIGQFVMRDKQHICAIQSYKNGLLLSTLNYGYEIKENKKFNELKAIKLEKAELTLAEELINKLTVKKFDINKFKDTFAEQLQKRIKQAAKGVKVPEVKIKKVKRKPEISLMETLRASLKTQKPLHKVVPIARAKGR